VTFGDTKRACDARQGCLCIILLRCQERRCIWDLVHMLWSIFFCIIHCIGWCFWLGYRCPLFLLSTNDTPASIGSGRGWGAMIFVYGVNSRFGKHPGT
jgi:hypothetical protein